MKPKPEWWPANPYPEDVFPLTCKEYSKMFTPQMRSSVSGCLGRMFWDIASEQIWEAWQNHMEEKWS